MIHGFAIICHSVERINPAGVQGSIQAARPGKLRLIERRQLYLWFRLERGNTAPLPSNRAHIPYLPSVFARHTVSGPISHSFPTVLNPGFPPIINDEAVFVRRLLSYVRRPLRSVIEQGEERGGSPDILLHPIPSSIVPLTRKYTSWKGGRRGWHTRFPFSSFRLLSRARQRGWIAIKEAGKFSVFRSAPNQRLINQIESICRLVVLACAAIARCYCSCEYRR